MTKYEGVVCVLKPPGMSSSDAVTDIRRVFSEKRVGHTGTLDPAASGVLPICIGRATRLFDFLVDKKKEYIAEIAFGVATDTEDATGAVIAKAPANISLQQIEATLPLFRGDIEQTPPMYSALSINGVKLYKLARKGELIAPIEAKRRSVSIYELETLRQTGKNRFLIRIQCSKGTYIRTLCKDIGRALGVPAYMAFLLRTQSGAFKLENAYSIAELMDMRDMGTLDEAVIPMDSAAEHIPEIRLDGLSQREYRLLVNGAPIKVRDGRQGTSLRVYANGDFLGIGVIGEEGALRITVWLGNEESMNQSVALTGTVCRNRRIGSSIGFPTANLTGYDKKQLPEQGVYATIAIIDGIKYQAVTSIGSNPTVSGKEVTVETHIIDRDINCYGSKITVRFVKRLRGMIRFANTRELAEQISKDIEAARQALHSV